MKHLLAFATFLAAVTTAHANPSCLPRELILQFLNNDFQEYQVGWGVELKGKHVVEIFVSDKQNGLTPDPKSFTVLVSYLNGVSCVIASGRNCQYKK